MHRQRIDEEAIQQMQQANGEQAPHCTPSHHQRTRAALAPRRQLRLDCVPPDI